MIKINLLPQKEIKAYVDIKREIFIVILSYTLIVLVLTYISINLHTQQKALRGRLYALNTQIQKYKSIDKKLKALKQKKKIVEKKIRIVSNLEKDRKKILAVLEAISENFLVGKMWFEDLEIKGDRVHIKGVALGNESIAEFMKGLKHTILFQKVDLIKSQKRKVQNLNLTSFELECKIIYLPKEKNRNAGKT